MQYWPDREMSTVGRRQNTGKGIRFGLCEKKICIGEFCATAANILIFPPDNLTLMSKLRLKSPLPAMEILTVEWLIYSVAVALPETCGKHFPPTYFHFDLFTQIFWHHQTSLKGAKVSAPMVPSGLIFADSTQKDCGYLFCRNDVREIFSASGFFLPKQLEMLEFFY